MVKIEFPADRTDIALAIGSALVQIGGGAQHRRSADRGSGARRQSAAATTSVDEEAVSDMVGEAAGHPVELEALRPYCTSARLSNLADEPEQQQEAPGKAAGIAFGAPAAQPEQAVSSAPAPKNPGELMVWVSERQQAKRLTDADVTGAWQHVGVTVGELFMKTPAEQERLIAEMFAHLSAKAGA